MHNEGILKIMADKGKDEVVLSFHDSLLHDSDVLLLNEGQWLNDNLIGFMFELVLSSHSYFIAGRNHFCTV